MVSYLYYLPAGTPGNISRDGYATVEQQAIDTANPPLAFGVAVAIDATALTIRPIGAGDTAANVYGINVRPYPTTGGSGSDPLGTSTPPTAGITNVMVRGYINVQLNGATACYKNGTVYIRIANASTGKPIGGFEAAADGTNTIVCPFHTYFTGPADTNNIAEVAFNI